MAASTVAGDGGHRYWSRKAIKTSSAIPTIIEQMFEKAKSGQPAY